MKAISLTQPWASLVAVGEKRYETRSWRTNYRGQIAIHASKAYPTKAREFAAEVAAPWLKIHNVRIVDSDGRPMLPLGAVVAIANLVGVYPTIEAPICGRKDLRSMLLDIPSAAPSEHLFGDYSDGRFFFVLSNVRRLREPVPCAGALSIWNVPSKVEVLVRQAHYDGPRGAL